ncbi:hypothetical protein [Nocardia flavorosea]|uniref:Uncharacterized protein n=1 Tax=Nocardia flavorosea TaxID=53429 RepID=A0A846YGX5_9NOCA|nr:hypothetical protein [Nocardia flavorosea]NKY58237.1 hypothetical protein [Nocardia flavorosea]
MSVQLDCQHDDRVLVDRLPRVVDVKSRSGAGLGACGAQHGGLLITGGFVR